jgi:hypothetical protein
VITIYQDTISVIADNRNVYVGNNELANRAAASLWQRCRGQLARKEIMYCNAGSLAPCDTEIEVAAEVGAAIKRMESSGDLLAE